MSPTDIRTALGQQKARASWWAIAKQSAVEWLDDNVMTWAAAIACYVLLALAPLLVIAIRVVAVFLGPKAEQVVSSQAGQWMGSASTEAIKEIIHQISTHRSTGVVATIISIVLVVISAGGVFGELQQAMNRVWKVNPKPGRALWGFLQSRLKSIIVIAIVALLMLGSFFVIGALQHFSKSLSAGWTYVMVIVEALIAVGVLTLIFALLYKVVPDAEIEWHTTWVGALITAVLFELGQYGLAAYFKYGAPSSAYGAVGSLAAVLIWIYYSAQIVLFGAEFTQVYAKQRRHGVRPSRHAQFLKECDETETATPSSEEPGRKPPKPRPRRPISEPQYGLVLDRYSPPFLASEQAEAEGEDGRRSDTLVTAGVGLVAGVMIGALGALQARRDQTHSQQSRQSTIDGRIARVRDELGRLGAVQRLLQRPNLDQRLDRLEREAQRLAGKGFSRRSSWRRPSPFSTRLRHFAAGLVGGL